MEAKAMKAKAIKAKAIKAFSIWSNLYLVGRQKNGVRRAYLLILVLCLRVCPPEVSHSGKQAWKHTQKCPTHFFASRTGRVMTTCMSAEIGDDGGAQLFYV